MSTALVVADLVLTPLLLVLAYWAGRNKQKLATLDTLTKHWDRLVPCDAIESIQQRIDILGDL